MTQDIGASVRQPPFPKGEYQHRISRTRARMSDEGYTHLLVSDPANICYLTGFDACSFYVPQALLLPAHGEPAFFCREIDASSVWSTTYLAESQVLGYPEPLVQQPHVHPMDWVAARIRPRLDSGAVLAVEADSPYYPVRSHSALVAGLGRAVEVVQAPSIVNWVRAIKSPAEIDVLRVAGRITEAVFETARAEIRPGVRQCDAVAEIAAAQIRGLDDAGGSYSAVPPLVLAGERTAFPHVAWTDQPFEDDQAVALELSGVRHRYHVPVARTMYLGSPPKRLAQLSEIVGEGLEAALGAARPGASGEAVAAAWNAVIEPHGLSKSGRVGYPVGIGYAPDWGEQTMSLRLGDVHKLAPGMTFHVMIGMWLDGWGYSISETVLMTELGAEPLSHVPRGLLRSSRG